MATFCELIFETCFEALVQMVVWRIFLKGRELIALVKDLADENTVDTDASLSTEIHYARIGIAFFEKQVMIILVYEVYFNFV